MFTAQRIFKMRQARLKDLNGETYYEHKTQPHRLVIGDTVMSVYGPLRTPDGKKCQEVGTITDYFPDWYEVEWYDQEGNVAI